MIQELLYLDTENTERCFTTPPIIVQENKRSPLLGYAGIVPVRNLIERLDIASVLDTNISVLKRCRRPRYYPYNARVFISEYFLTLEKILALLCFFRTVYLSGIEWEEPEFRVA